MNIKEIVTKGKKNSPPRIMIYGHPGIGKSTFCSGAPNPVFVQTEDGLDQIESAKFPLAKNYLEVIKYLDCLIDESHEFQTIVIDSLDWLERLIHRDLCNTFSTDSIEKIMGGYGKGYVAALKSWDEIIKKLEWLRDEKNMAVILTCHAKIEKYEDPEGSYDRNTIKLHRTISGPLIEWCDAILFATKKIRREKEQQGFGKERNIAKSSKNDDRVIICYTQLQTIAKNRYGISEEIPLSWEDFFQSINQN